MAGRVLRPITWLGDSRDVVRSFSKPVRDRIGDELYRLQIGLDPQNRKPMTSIGPGAQEIRVSFSGQFRLIYVLRPLEGIVVLNAFRKKSRRTSRADVELARQRLGRL
jgi:phage-related protein